ncbi:MAG: UGMP family protein [Nanoarchaeota archaeon]|nr:UGMP family protein [Nanoarchaeota archaeon]
MLTILGIESTAHTFGVGVVRNGKVFANVRSMYVTETGGIIPTDSAKHHKEVAQEIYLKALGEAGIKESEIDAIAFSQGPGLAPCLIEGMKFAKKLSGKLGKSLVGVNHCVAHLEIGQITGAKDPVMLYASGANTQIIAYASGKYRVFGETLDLGVGNFIDTFARYAGIGFPGGPKIQKLAEQGKNYIELPYKVKGMDIALSGILTNLKQKLGSLQNRSQMIGSVPDSCQGTSLKNKLSDNKFKRRNLAKPISKQFKSTSEQSERDYTLNDLAYSLQETVFAMLVETAERALAHTGKKELLLGGGVACNSRLQEMCKIMCKERGAKFFCPDRSLLVDNAAMIAYLGEIMFKNKRHPSVSFKLPRNTERRFQNASCETAKNIFLPSELDKVDILPRQRTDDVEVKWK